MKLNKFTGGLALGTIIGLLIAPDKGSKTRQKIADTAHNIKETATNLKEQIEDLFKKGDSDLDELKTLLQDEKTTLDNQLRIQLVQLVDRSKKYYAEAKKKAD